MKSPVIEPVTVEEVPGLREACEGEAAAVRLIHDLKLRLQTARASIVLRERDRDALASRVAMGEDVTGADLRQATEAVSDAEGTVKLIEDAMPKAISAARKAHSARSAAERLEYARAMQPFQSVLAEAEAALRHAQRAVDAAKANTVRLPRDAQEKLDALLAHHGRAPSAASYVSHLSDIERTNASIANFNQAVGAGQQRPLQPWPP